MKRNLLILIFILPGLVFSALRADEGIWIPILIEKYNLKIMQEKGFKLSSEDIYSVNRACMKDAVLKFGGECTGAVISPEGLIITNHHCGRGQIQQHSSLEHDYLTNAVCFIANNHTTGGNSGSPVVNAEGQLIGINFDRAWEGVASDMAYNTEQSRNISLDIRYALFIIDKFADAGYLLKEMKIIE